MALIKIWFSCLVDDRNYLLRCFGRSGHRKLYCWVSWVLVYDLSDTAASVFLSNLFLGLWRTSSGLELLVNMGTLVAQCQWECFAIFQIRWKTDTQQRNIMWFQENRLEEIQMDLIELLSFNKSKQRWINQCWWRILETEFVGDTTLVSGPNI